MTMGWRMTFPFFGTERSRVARFDGLGSLG